MRLAGGSVLRDHREKVSSSCPSRSFGDGHCCLPFCRHRLNLPPAPGLTSDVLRVPPFAHFALCVKAPDRTDSSHVHLSKHHKGKITAEVEAIEPEESSVHLAWISCRSKVCRLSNHPHILFLVTPTVLLQYHRNPFPSSTGPQIDF